MNDRRSADIPPGAIWAKRLGQMSVVSVFVSVFLGFLFDAVGINSLLLSYVIPLSLTTIVLSLAVRGGMQDAGSPGYREATLGLRMGLGVLIAVLIFMAVVAAFFILWLRPS